MTGASLRDRAPAGHARAVEVLDRQSGGLECFARGADETLPGGHRRQQMDAFSEVLSGVKLKGALFFSAEFSAPWALSTPRSQHAGVGAGARRAASRGLPLRRRRLGPGGVARRTGP